MNRITIQVIQAVKGSREEGQTSDPIAQLKYLAEKAWRNDAELQAFLNKPPCNKWNCQVLFNLLKGQLKVVELAKIRSLNEF